MRDLARRPTCRSPACTTTCGARGAAVPYPGALLSPVLGGAERALAARGHAEPGERLQGFIRHHVTFFAAHMAEMKVLSHEATSLTGERQRKVNAIKRRYVDLLEGLLKDVAPDESRWTAAPPLTCCSA